MRILVLATLVAIGATALIGILGSWLSTGILRNAVEHVVHDEHRLFVAQVESELGEAVDAMVQVVRSDAAVGHRQLGARTPDTDDDPLSIAQKTHRAIQSLAYLDESGRELAVSKGSRPIRWPAVVERAISTQRPAAIVDPALRGNVIILAIPAGAQASAALVASIDLSETRAFRNWPAGARFDLLSPGAPTGASARNGESADDAVTTRVALTLAGPFQGASMPVSVSRRVPPLGAAIKAIWWRSAGVLAAFAAIVGLLASWIAHRRMRSIARARRDLEQRVEERTREMEALRDRQAGILGAINDVVYTVTPDLQHVRFVNRAGEAATGLPAELLASVRGLWLEHVHESDREGLLAAIGRACIAGVGSHTYRIADESGVLRHFQDRFAAVRNEAGEVTHIQGVATDVTERVYAEEARQMAEAMLRLKDRALESSSNGVTISDMRLPDQPLVYVNRGFETMTGYEANEVYGLNCRFLQGADRNQPAVAELSQAIAELRPCTVVLRNYRKDGTAFWNELSVSPVLDADGRATHCVGVQTDITARMLAEARAKERARRLDSIFALSPDGFVSFDAGGRVAHVNPAFTRMTGIESGAVLRRTREDFDALFRAIADPSQPYPTIAGEELAANQCTVTIVSPERRILERSARGGSGGDSATVLYFRDVTRETEVDRMKSEFLSTAAHELRTPMASIRGFSELLLRRQYDEATRRDLVETILKQSVRLTGLLNELLDLARIEARGGKDFRLRVQPLAKIVEDTIGSLMVHGDSRKVEVRMPERPVLVNVDADKLQQALTNVVSNAYKYSPAGGAIELEVKVAEGDVPEAVVSVHDHGLGLTPEQLARCFERFFRADTSGNIPGTGLGLALVKEIVELHGGRAEISSVYGEGTRVTMRLPLARAEGAALAA